MGFEKLSDIQAQGILPMLEGKDLIVQSRAGSGKTIAFIISLLQLIDDNASQCQVLILEPNRELARHIQQLIIDLGKYIKPKVHTCIGGINLKEEIEKLQEGAKIIVGTPGRVHEMLKRGHIKTTYFKLLVMDEADDLFAVGFEEQIREILKITPEDVQITVFSPTIPLEVLRLTRDFMKDPVTILVRHEQFLIQNTKQFYIPLDKAESKVDALIDLFEHIGKFEKRNT